MANPEHLKILKQGVEAWNAWRGQCSERIDLQEADLLDVKLVGANFSDAKMEKVILARANLSHTNFFGAELHSALFEGANLSGANLQRAVPVGASFFHAKLIGANLTESTLDFANFHLADLRSANFSHAELGYTLFSQTNLKDARSLETCRHLGPSSIDFETLQRSGILPKLFLRGCGMSDGLIDSVSSVNTLPNNFYSCFISYSHRDKPFARLLHDRLQERGIRCWLDEHQLLPGDDLHERIDRAIQHWDKMLLCASKASLTSWWVDGEMNRAFQKEAQIMKERAKKVLALIPLNLDGFLFTNDYQSGKKSEITSRNAADFVGWENDHVLFDRELEKVIRALRVDEAGREKPPLPKL